jgi:hypothetical protein
LEEVEIGCIYNSKNGNDTWGACAEAGTCRGKRGWGKMRECGKFDFQYHNLGVKILKTLKGEREIEKWWERGVH